MSSLPRSRVPLRLVLARRLRRVLTGRAGGREDALLRSIMRAGRKHAPGLLIRKTHGDGYGVKGEPDLIGAYEGRMFAIELKRPGESPTRLQAQRLHEWKLAGAITGCAHTVPEFMELLGIDHVQQK